MWYYTDCWCKKIKTYFMKISFCLPLVLIVMPLPASGHFLKMLPWGVNFVHFQHNGMTSHYFCLAFILVSIKSLFKCGLVNVLTRCVQFYCYHLMMICFTSFWLYLLRGHVSLIVSIKEVTTSWMYLRKKSMLETL